MGIILGIDPGSRVTGYGVIRSQRNQHVYLASGSIKVASDELPKRLHNIYLGLTEIIQTYQPQFVAIEQVFIAKNANSALKLGQARGAAIVAAVAQGLPVAEYSARNVKQAVVGYGNADKSQVQHMVKLLLNLSGLPQVDAADALAIAICHAHNHLQSLAMKNQLALAGTAA